MATNCSVLAWRIPRTEEPGGCSPQDRKESDRTERQQPQVWRAGGSGPCSVTAETGKALKRGSVTEDGSTDMSLSKPRELVMDREAWWLQSMGSQSQTRVRLNGTELMYVCTFYFALQQKRTHSTPIKVNF